MKKTILSMALLAISMLASAQDFTLGADISWYTEIQSKGFKFYNAEGEMRDCPELMKEAGMNAARLRVWVDPAGSFCGKDDVVKKAAAAKAAGLDVMIDFHFSDTWADPSNQAIPSAWKSHSAAELKTDIANHVTDVLTALKDAGVTPKWVQIGNETNDGMLWDLGKASKYPTNYKNYVAAGYDAVKAFDSSILVIVHISNANDQSLFDWNIGLLNQNKLDIIGMSLYPDDFSKQITEQKISEYIANVKHLYTKFGKNCMLVEVGVPVGQPEESYKTLKKVLDLSKNSADGHCLGVFYWEPDAYAGYNGGYSLGASTKVGTKVKLTKAMDAFKEMSVPDGIESVSLSKKDNSGIYNLQGQKLNGEPSKGFYIKGNKKYAKK